MAVIADPAWRQLLLRMVEADSSEALLSAIMAVGQHCRDEGVVPGADEGAQASLAARRLEALLNTAMEKRERCPAMWTPSVAAAYGRTLTGVPRVHGGGGGSAVSASTDAAIDWREATVGDLLRMVQDAAEARWAAFRAPARRRAQYERLSQTLQEEKQRQRRQAGSGGLAEHQAVRSWHTRCCARARAKARSASAQVGHFVRIQRRPLVCAMLVLYAGTLAGFAFVVHALVTIE